MYKNVYVSEDVKSINEENIVPETGVRKMRPVECAETRVWERSSVDKKSVRAFIFSGNPFRMVDVLYVWFYNRSRCIVLQ